MPSGSNSQSVNSFSSKRKGSDEGDASQSSGGSGKRNLSGAGQKISLGWNTMGRKCDANLAAAGSPTEIDSSSVFVTGSTNFKIESIRSHEKSNGHNRAVAAIEVAENPR